MSSNVVIQYQWPTEIITVVWVFYYKMEYGVVAAYTLVKAVTYTYTILKVNIWRNNPNLL